MHGQLPCLEGRYDIVLIAGDISPVEIQFRKDEMAKWYASTFIRWVEALPADRVVLVAGNHDAWLQNASRKKIDLLPGKMVYLRNEGYSFIGRDGKEWKIFGSPYCHAFGTWPFMVDDAKLREKFAAVPEGLDILLTHDAPYGCSDICLEYDKDKHRGGIPLMEAVLAKRPRVHMHGHLHSASHEREVLGTTDVYNVSLLSEHYTGRYEPLVLELEK